MQKHTDSKKTGATQQYVKALLASTALASAGMTYGQADQAADSEKSTSNEGTALEEIVVRGIARKYRPDESNAATGLDMQLIDTPQAITVLTTEMMDTIGAVSVYEATDLVPGVQRSGFGFGLDQIVMRGVFLERQRINGALQANRLVSPHSDLMERVEVVRGPATVLYGVTGAFGGEINNVLKKPEAQTYMSFELEGEILYGSQNSRFDLTGTLPGTDDRLRGRITMVHDDIGLPYDIKNADPRHEEFNIMGALEWDISDNTQFTVWYARQNRKRDAVDGGALVKRATDGTLALPQDVFDIDPDTWYFSHPDQSQGSLDTELLIADVKHTFANDWRGKVQAAWSKYDYDSSLFYPFGPFGAYGGLAYDEVYMTPYDRTRNQNELTFNASLGGSFELFEREHDFFAAFEYVDSLDPFTDVQFNSQFGIGNARYDLFADGVYNGFQAFYTDGSPHVPTDRNTGINTQSEVEKTDYKLSLSALFRPSDRLQVLLGVLVQDNRTEEKVFQGLAGTTHGLAPNPSTTDTTFTEVVKRFGVTYNLLHEGNVIDDANVYFSYSEGFEPQVIFDINNNPDVIPQEMESFEVGLKAEFLAGAVGASLAYYDSEIINVTSTGISVTNVSALAEIIGGTQDTKGIEFEMVGEILPGWNVAFNYAYTDSVISDPQFDFTTRPRTVPENAAALITSYEFIAGPLRGLRIGATFKVSDDYAFVDALRQANKTAFRSDAGEPGLLVDGAHERLDLNVSYDGFTGELEGLRIYGIFYNVTDEDIIVAKQRHPGLGIMFIDRPAIKFGLSYSI